MEIGSQTPIEDKEVFYFMNHFDIYKDLGQELVDCLKKEFETPIQLQVFRTNIYDGDILQAIQTHQYDILQAIVYSQFGEMTPLLDPKKIVSMSGFLEQKGRLPNKNDQIKIIRGRLYFEITPDCIISEIWFQIIEPNKS